MLFALKLSLSYRKLIESIEFFCHLPLEIEQFVEMLNENSPLKLEQKFKINI